MNQAPSELFPCSGTATLDVAWSALPPGTEPSPNRAARVLVAGPVGARDLQAPLLLVPLLAWVAMSHATGRELSKRRELARAAVQDLDPDAAQLLWKVTDSHAWESLVTLGAVRAGDGGGGGGITAEREHLDTQTWKTMPVRAHELVRGYASLHSSAQALAGGSGEEQAGRNANNPRSAASTVQQWLSGEDSAAWGGSIMVEASRTGTASWSGAHMFTQLVSHRRGAVVVAISALPMHSAAARGSQADMTALLAAGRQVGESAVELGHEVGRRLGSDRP